MSHDKHGGGCCGMFHIHSFPASMPFAVMKTPADFIKREVKAGIVANYEAYYESEDCGCECCDNGPDAGPEDMEYVCDAVLAEYQYYLWKQPLLDAGFKLVGSFTNSNSTNECSIFHLNTKEFKWQ